MKHLLQKFLVVALLVGIAVIPSMQATMQEVPTGDNPSDPGVLPNGDLVPGYHQQFPSEGRALVSRNNSGDSATRALCDSMAWSYNTTPAWYDIFHFRAYTHVASLSRDISERSYPCDIDRIGARARYWSDDVLQEDTNMLDAVASAEKTVQTTTYGECAFYILMRGNHVFEDAQAGALYPQTENSC
jgi:hypothetical protein